VDLGVHQVIGGGPVPAYIRRPHDDLLRAVLDPVVSASRLVVVRGGSSTGKTRAAYEAVAGQLADWQLDYPLDVAALKERLDTGIPARTVLWLGELRQYVDADGGAEVLGRLGDLLDGEGRLVVTTVWPEHWNAYTAAARAGRAAADPAGTVGRLLERLPEPTGRDLSRIDPARGGVIDVPDRFSPADLEAAAHTDDPALAAAAAAAASAGQGGQVTQYLAGVPDLLDRWHKPGGDPYGQAIITAAMDATRLGHASLLPAGLVQGAAVGYLTAEERTKDIAIWRDDALAWATAELRGAVRALQPVAPLASTGVAGYQVADYLDQYGRRTRQDQLGPPSLWEALTVYATSASDLTRLGYAAGYRGLYRHTAALYTAATTLGGTPHAARQLIAYVRRVSPGDTTRVARWVAGHVSLDDLYAVAWLLRDLRGAGTTDAVQALAARAAAHAPLGNPDAVRLLQALRDAGDSDAVQALAARAAAHAPLDDPGTVAGLLRDLRGAGTTDAVQALAARAAAHAPLDNPDAVARLLQALRAAGDSDAIQALLARDPAGHARLDNPLAIGNLLKALRAAGDSDAVQALAARAAADAPLDDPGTVAGLLQVLREAGDGDAVQALLARDPAAHAPLGDTLAVTGLMWALRGAGASDAGHALAVRAAADAPLGDPTVAGLLLGALRAAGDSDAVQALLAREPAGHARLDNPLAIGNLLKALRAVGDNDAVQALAARAAADTPLDDPQTVSLLLQVLLEAGDGDAVQALLARDPAAHAPLDDTLAVTGLLQALGAAGDNDAVHALAARAAAHAPLDDDTGAVARLLQTLRLAGERDAVHALLDRDPAAHAPLDDTGTVDELLQALRAVRATDAVDVLATRAANAGMFDLFLEACPDEALRYLFGREPDGTPSQPWRWEEPGRL
jgi:hypothetical protein